MELEPKQAKGREVIVAIKRTIISHFHILQQQPYQPNTSPIHHTLNPIMIAAKAFQTLFLVLAVMVMLGSSVDAAAVAKGTLARDCHHQTNRFAFVPSPFLHTSTFPAPWCTPHIHALHLSMSRLCTEL